MTDPSPTPDPGNAPEEVNEADDDLDQAEQHSAPDDIDTEDEEVQKARRDDALSGGEPSAVP